MAYFAQGLSTKLILLMLWSTLVLYIIEKTKAKWSMQIREYNLSLYFLDYIIARRPLCDHGKKEGKESCWTHHQNRIDFQREIDFLGHVCQWHTDPSTLQCLFAENVAETSKETKVEEIRLAAFFLPTKRQIQYTQRWFLLLWWNLKWQYIYICKCDFFCLGSNLTKMLYLHVQIWRNIHVSPENLNFQA